MKKVNAQITIDITTDCPYCEETIWLDKLSELSQSEMIMDAALGDSRIGYEGLDEPVTCPECKKEFILGDLEW
jgi:uncharacterized Zn-finger protein